MQICGIIAEYNPFHNGHEKHIEQTRKKAAADLIICVMSGNFVQRGEPAVFDKWTRAALALHCGADAVLEMPLLHAVQSAEGFAAGGVAVLDAVGANAISFGCETDDIAMLNDIAKTLSNETSEYKQMLKKYLGQGLSFPKARMKAAFATAPEETCMPNSILAIEYLKAIHKTKSPLTPYAIKRFGQGYHSTDTGTSFSSATAIRKALAEKNDKGVHESMPDVCVRYLTQQLDKGLLPVFPNCFDQELIFTLRLKGTEYIQTLHEVTEGLENRIYEAAKVCTTKKELIEKIKTKRYTYTRISRILLYALLGITKEMIKKVNSTPINHIRVLGVKSPNVLSVLSGTSSAPILAGSVASSSYANIDIAASDVYALSQKSQPFCSAARDYTHKLIIC